MKNQKQFLESDGYVVLSDLIDKNVVDQIKEIYDLFLSGQVETSGYRSDLSGKEEKSGDEKIIQIMCPSRLYPNLAKTELYKICHLTAITLLGNDMALDFDMLIDKAPHTDTETPIHQDEAYWPPELTDKRAISFWVALDDAKVENGCMWYVPKSNKGTLLPHQQMPNGGALVTEHADKKDGLPVELDPGSCVAHTGRTLHFSLGNRTDQRRRAIILNFRPQKMIDLERALGYDHTGERKLQEK